MTKLVVTPLAQASDGYVLCYDCGGERLCVACDGEGTRNGELCRWCSGRRYCLYCKGEGEVLPRRMDGGAPRGGAT